MIEMEKRPPPPKKKIPSHHIDLLAWSVVADLEVEICRFFYLYLHPKIDHFIEYDYVTLLQSSKTNKPSLSGISVCLLNKPTKY